jgi:phospholipid/cholesterol/gamma-HCH transport system substrate-binding protein
MKRGSIITWEQVRVAGVVAVSLAILLFGGYKLAKAANLIGEKYQLVAFVPTANGIRVGGSVTVAGQLAGSVSEIEFLPIDDDTTRNLRLVVELDENVREQVRADSRARLRTQGLLGDRVFDISPGTRRASALRPGDTIVVAPTVEYDQVIQQASGAVGDVVGLSRDLRSITGGIVKGEGTVGQLVTNRGLYDQLAGTLERTNALLGRMQNPNGTIGRLMSDPELYNTLTRTTASLDTLVGQIARSEGTVGKLLKDDSLYVRLVGVAAGADSVVKLMTRGNGIVPRLLNDQGTYDNLNRALVELNGILEDVRRNPQKYTKGLIKVF